MFAFAEDFWFSKVTWTVIIGILTALIAGASGQMSWANVGLTIFASLLTLFHRDAVVKTADQAIYYQQQVAKELQQVGKIGLPAVEEFVNRYAVVHHSTIAATVAHVLDALGKITKAETAGTVEPMPAPILAVEPAPAPVTPEPVPAPTPAVEAPQSPVTMIEALIAQHVAEAVAKALGANKATEPVDGEADGK